MTKTAPRKQVAGSKPAAGDKAAKGDADSLLPPGVMTEQETDEAVDNVRIAMASAGLKSAVPERVDGEGAAGTGADKKDEKQGGDIKEEKKGTEAPQDYPTGEAGRLLKEAVELGVAAVLRAVVAGQLALPRAAPAIPPHPLFNLGLAQGPAAHDIKKEPAAGNDWGGCVGAGLSCPMDLLAADDRAKKGRKPVSITQRPWEHGGWARSSSACARASADPLVNIDGSGVPNGAEATYKAKSAGPKSKEYERTLVVMGCRCQPRGLKGGAVIDEHRTLAAWRWVAGGGSRLWSNPPPCLAKALGYKTPGAIAEACDRENRASKTAGAQKMRDTLVELYYIMPSGDGVGALKKAWKLIDGAGPKRKRRDSSEEDEPDRKKPKKAAKGKKEKKEKKAPKKQESETDDASSVASGLSGASKDSSSSSSSS